MPEFTYLHGIAIIALIILCAFCFDRGVQHERKRWISGEFGTKNEEDKEPYLFEHEEDYIGDEVMNKDMGGFQSISGGRMPEVEE